MSSIDVPHALSGRRRFAGREWFYEFRVLPEVLGEESSTEAAARLMQR